MFITGIIIGFAVGFGLQRALRPAPPLRSHILAELSHGNGTGGELCTRIELAHGYRPSMGAIYPMLRKLQAEGTVTCFIEPGGVERGGRQRYVYSLPRKMT
jgi:DNA-binding PadR family transcriptional regulator